MVASKTDLIHIMIYPGRRSIIEPFWDHIQRQAVLAVSIENIAEAYRAESLPPAAATSSSSSRSSDLLA